MGLRLEDLGRSLTWLDLKAVVACAPPDSALVRALDPDWWVTPEVRMLREMELSLRYLIWFQTKDGQQGRNRPQAIPLTVAEVKARHPERDRYDAMPLDEMATLLGWDAPKIQGG